MLPACGGGGVVFPDACTCEHKLWVGQAWQAVSQLACPCPTLTPMPSTHNLLCYAGYVLGAHVAILYPHTSHI